MWVFGYGSLIWKQYFPVKRQLTGHIKGFMRRFWQGSTDHRGVPGNDKVWGVAFEIPEDHVDEVRAQLDHREQRYTPTHVTFYPRDARETEITLKLYIGTDTGPNYLGPAELEDIAAQIYRSEGPSGKNVDYLFNLANSLRTLMPHVTDEHVFDLEQLVLEMKRREEMQQT